MEGHVNTYGGMNKDTAYDTIKQNMYIDALDIRITTTTGESQGAFTNIKGNVLSFVIPKRNTEVPSGNNFGGWLVSGNAEVIGYTSIRNKIILFVADDTNTGGWIYEVEYNPADRTVDTAVYPKLIYYNAALNFKKSWPIEALGRYENAATQKIYWTDYNNIFRTINIADPNLSTFPVSNVDIYPDVKYTQPILESVAGGGQLNSGKYQIAYRLITSDGKETLVSPPSNMIHIVTSSEYDSVPKYVGEPTKINTGKSINISIDTTNYLNIFEKIEILALYYESDIATPTAVSVETQSIATNTINVIYTGAEGTIFDIELFTFASKNFAFKTFKSVTQKDNYLVGANIKSSTIDVQDLLEGGDTFDAKTKRYNGAATPLPPFTPGTPEHDLNNAFNQEFNQDKHWDPTWHTAAKQYKYQSNGTTLGGEGANISYSFHLEPITVDVESQPRFHNIGGNIKYGYDSHDLNDGYGTYPNPSFANNASPHTSGLLRGYKRGETYRFGIVFYTLKGEATYVEYIGDIKFPDISERDGVSNISGNYFPLSTLPNEFPAGGFAGTIATGFNLGIKFTLNLPTSLLNNITGYQIVRVPRTNADKRRLASGIVNPLGYRITGSSAPNDYDFRVDNNENVIHHVNANPTSATRFSANSLGAIIDQQDPNTIIGAVSGVFVANATIRGQHLSFYSPEISYKYSRVSDIATNLGNNPSLLITGNYSFASASSINYDWSVNEINNAATIASNLGAHVSAIYDTGIKFRRVRPVTFNSVENLRKLNDSHYFDMRDSTNVNISTKTTQFGQADNGGNAPLGPAGSPTMPAGNSYMRNYFVTSNNLNDPSGFGTGLARAGSNISVLTKQFTQDPLTGTAISSADQATTDYFLVKGTTSHNPTGGDAIQALDNNGNSTGLLGNQQAIAIADLLIPKTEVYGGNSSNSLEANTFIPASPFIDKTNLNPKVYGGDIFITMYSLQKALVEFNADFYDQSTAKSYQTPFTRTELFITESCVNTNLHHGANTTSGVEFKYQFAAASPIQSAFYRQEDNNSFSNYGKLESGASLYKMYGYNEVFSKINEEVAFFVKPSTLTDLSLTNDIRSFLSSVKVNGEAIDSWTKFAINDYYDVDDHGPINKIINFKDNIYFFQDQATGVYSINREAVTTTDDGVPTELGTAKGWGKHQYYSKEVGVIHQWAVAATNNAIYFFDAIHRKIYQLGQGKQGMSTSPLSELKGMHSYLQELGPGVFNRKEDNGDNPILNNGAHIGLDEINDEVIFTFLSSSPRYTPNDQFNSIVFDEIAQQFSTRLSVTPKIWINNADNLITSNISASTTDMYTHNIGNWGEFYGVDKELELTLVINPKADINKVLRFLEFNSIVRNDAKQITRTETITAFRVKTETQDSGKILYSAGRIKRRFDKWRIKLPRDINSTSQKGRFRSTHFLLTLYFDNTYNKELIMNRLISYYDPQIF